MHCYNFRALTMPLDERALRMNQLKKREKKMDVDAWVKVRQFVSSNQMNIHTGHLTHIYFWAGLSVAHGGP